MALLSSTKNSDIIAKGTNSQRPSGQGGKLRLNPSSNKLEWYRESSNNWEFTPTPAYVANGSLRFSNGYGVSMSATNNPFRMNASATTSIGYSINTNELDRRYRTSPPPPIFRLKASSSWDARGANPDYTNGHIKGCSITRTSIGVWEITFHSGSRPIQDFYVVATAMGDQRNGAYRTLKIQTNGQNIIKMDRNGFRIAFGGNGIYGSQNDGAMGGTYQAFQVFTGS